MRRALLFAAVLCMPPVAAEAAPKRIIILRHSEKQDPPDLCAIGVERAQALAAQSLGPADSAGLLAGEKPAVLAITLHTLETARVIAAAWGLDVDTNALMLTPIRDHRLTDGPLNEENRRVARDLLDNPRWYGRTVVMVWEHHRIASRKLERKFPGEEVTLRQLLHLGEIDGVPKSWPDDNYNFFWVLDYDGPSARVPSKFTVLRQQFAPPFDDLPSNDWGEATRLPAGSGCL